MHDRDPFRAPAREPKPGTFHRPAHGLGIKRAPEAAKLRLSGPMTGEQKLGEGLAELPLAGTQVKQNRRLARHRGPKPDRRRALQLLAASTDGHTEGLLRAHGITSEMVTELVRDGLATTNPERVVIGTSAIEVTRVRITEAGRRALAGS